MGETQQLLLERKLALVDNVINNIKDYHAQMEDKDKSLLRSSKQAIRELQNELATERSAYERLQLEHNQLITQYDNLNADYQADHAKFNTIVSSLRKQLQDSQVLIQHLKQVILGKADPSVHPEIQLDYELLKQNQQGQDNELHTQVDALQQESARQKDQIQQLTHQITSLQSQLRDAVLAQQEAINNSKTYQEQLEQIVKRTTADASEEEDTISSRARFSELIEINRFLLQKLSDDQNTDDQAVINSAVSNKLHTLKLQDEVDKLRQQIADYENSAHRDAVKQLVALLKLPHDAEQQVLNTDVQAQLNSELFKHKYGPVSVQIVYDSATQEELESARTILQNTSILRSILPEDEPLDLTNLATDIVLQIAVLKYIMENVDRFQAYSQLGLSRGVLSKLIQEGRGFF